MRDTMRHWRTCLAIFSVCAMILAFAPSAFTQTMTTGDIVGTVSDATGAVIPNSKVTIRFSETNEVHSAITNSNGQYRFSLLQPGEYSVSCEAPGLKSKTEKFT